jgi:hypothetical protein
MAYLMIESAKAQRQARVSQRMARVEIYRRLRAKVAPGTDGKTEAKVEAERPSSGELIRLMEAEANLVKDEAMAQRSYKLATMTGGQAAETDTYEAFILAQSVTGEQ